MRWQAAPKRRRSRQIVSFDRNKDEVLRARFTRIAGHERPDRHRAVLGLQRDAVLFYRAELLAARDQAHFGARLMQPNAEIRADRPRAIHRDFHDGEQSAARAP